MKLKKYFGDRAFYKMVLAVSVPIMVQNGISNFVSMLDNVMVGRLGTESMSGVSIVNQFIFIFNLVIFGAASAAGIFTAQYHGYGDVKGERDTFRAKMWISTLVGVAGVAFFALFDEPIISLFLHETESKGDLALTLIEGKRYLAVMLAGLLPFAFSNAYASTMRETGKTVVPMVASIVAVLTNFCFNYILIFGHFGAPALGVVGAAIATVISRFVELAVLVIWGHTHTKTYAFLAGAYRGLTVPGHLMGQIALKGLPLMFNEFFWSTAVTLRNQCYSTRGLDVVAAQNIASTIVNVFNVVFISLGSAVAIIIGNLLGAGKLEEAKDTDRKLLTFSVLSTLGMAILLCVSAPFFPLLYKTSDSVRELATYMMIASAAIMPFCAFANAAYFTIRAGGNVIITLLFDSVFMWVIVMPAAFLLSRFTGIGIRPLYLICQATEIIKVVFGVALIRSGTWLRSLVGDENPQEMS